MINNISAIQQTQITKRPFSHEMTIFISSVGVMDLVKDPQFLEKWPNNRCFVAISECRAPLRFEFHVADTAN